MSNQSMTPASPPNQIAEKNIIILFKAKASPDGELALSLESGLRRRGHTVTSAQKTSAGLAWVRELETALEQADLVIALVSAASAQSELMAYELEVAAQVAAKRDGFPRLMSVRVFYKGPLSEALAVLLQPVEFEWSAEEERYLSRMVLWRSPADDASLVDIVEERLIEIETCQTPALGGAPSEEERRMPILEPLGGAVPLDSKFYIERSTDTQFGEAVERRDSLVLVKGARQMGKTSLLARGLQQAREAGSRVVLTDFQKLQASHFATIEEFYRSLAELVADQMDLDLPEADRWRRNPNAAFEVFWMNSLTSLARPILWAVDEFDRLFTSSFGAEVCGLLRSWHNARALDPALPWRYLTVAIAYATEAHLFINDLNQSPFNVGTRLSLTDFSDAEVGELNSRYGEPLRNETEIGRLHQLLGGHPYLVRCALNEMTTHKGGLSLIEKLVGQEESVFGEHLRRLLYSVGREPAIAKAVKGLLLERTDPPREVFYRLRSAGVLVGPGPEAAQFRCDLYEQYLRRHLSS